MTTKEKPWGRFLKGYSFQDLKKVRGNQLEPAWVHWELDLC
jgi:hypothetical protein